MWFLGAGWGVLFVWWLDGWVFKISSHYFSLGYCSSLQFLILCLLPAGITDRFHQVQLRVLSGQLELILNYLWYCMTDKHITETTKCLVSVLFLKTNKQKTTNSGFWSKSFYAFPPFSWCDQDVILSEAQVNSVVLVAIESTLSWHWEWSSMVKHLPILILN